MIEEKFDKDYIVVKGARENNLKNVDVKFPKNKLVVFSGVSGSGKSTLAFDTIFAEGQRRYIESLSSYARQFLGTYEKPDVDSIEGLSPAISIDQKTTSHNPRSTVGTVTEIYDYLRVLFARIGEPYCPEHNVKISKTSVNKIVNLLLEKHLNEKLTIVCPLVRNEKGSHYETLKKFFSMDFKRWRIDEKVIVKYFDIPLLEKNKKHNLDLVLDRLMVSDDNLNRIYESLRLSFEYSHGFVTVIYENGEEESFSEQFSCPICGFSTPDFEPSLFSFNNPLGYCPDCKGLGVKIEADTKKIVPDESISINKGCIACLRLEKNKSNTEYYDIKCICDAYDIDMDAPYSTLTEKQKKALMYGPEKPLYYDYKNSSGSIIKKEITEGVKTRVDRLYYQTNSSFMKDYYESFMITKTCSSCEGRRLNKKVLCVKVNNLNISEVCDLPLSELYEFIDKLNGVLTEERKTIANLVLQEIKNRVGFLINVGLDYLSLSRMAMTLSGGESQRIRLATQIGSKLSGVLYVLDEPSIGLHQKDNEKLIATLKQMRDLGNSLIVVEHDEDTLRESDWIVDIGPNAGDQGGEIIYSGEPSGILNCEKSITGKYLSGKEKIEIPTFRRDGYGYIKVRNAYCNNLKNLNVDFKLGCLNVVTGVSGSGKSSLVNDVIYASLKKNNQNFFETKMSADVSSTTQFSKIINISQEPIGKTPRSNPATYVGVFDDIRELFASTIDAKMNGITKSMFSFNVPGGRCEACYGDGVKRISMNFLPDVYVKCEVCDGKRYNEDVLRILYKGKNIFDVLNMRIEEAYRFFEDIPQINRKLKTLLDVGLGYMTLGQSSVTLSGGEAQRIKLAYELQRRSDGGALYILDEPTTGLHTDDVKKLVAILSRLCANGNTCIVIEHNLDVIKCADYIVDLGPDGGDKGGTVVATGTPEEIAKCKKSYTGEYLRKIFNITI